MLLIQEASSQVSTWTVCSIIFSCFTDQTDSKLPCIIWGGQQYHQWFFSQYRSDTEPTISLTCNGRNTDSIVAALGWSGAGATIPPRPLSTPPGNESCGPGNKTKMSQDTMAKNNRNTREYGMWFRRRIYLPWECLGGELYGKKDGADMPGICGAWNARLSTFIPLMLPANEHNIRKTNYNRRRCNAAYYNWYYDDEINIMEIIIITITIGNNYIILQADPVHFAAR